MTLPNLVTVDELSTWMGVTLVDEDRAEAILAAASTLVRLHTGREWVDADDEVDGDVTELQLSQARTVVTLIAERVWSNPRGRTQQATGPFSESVAAWFAYGLALTDAEKALLGVPVGLSGVPGLTSVRVEVPRRAAGVPRFADDDTEWLL